MENGGIIFQLLAFVPLLLLVVFSLMMNMRTAAVISFIATTALFFFWKGSSLQYAAVYVTTTFATLNILMVVFGAILLYQTMQDSGYINRINDSVQQLNPYRDTRFFLIATGLTAFFEGVAGFGTPGAIVPLLLISMGYQPLLSVCVVLLADGIFAAFGAVGTPLLAGLKIPLDLDPSATSGTAVFAAIFLAIAAIVIALYSIRYYRKYEGEGSIKRIMLLWLSIIIPFTLTAFVFPEFATILSAVVFFIVAMIFFRKRKASINIKAWMPYLLLVMLLLLPKLVPLLDQMLDLTLSWDAIFGTSLDASIRPLKSPLLPFVLVALLYAKKKSAANGLKAAARKTLAVALVLFPVIGVAQLMLHSGEEQESMISQIAFAFSRAGDGYVLLAPFIGIIGSFVTGSTTVSNIVFGPSQAGSAALLGLDPSLVLSLQLAGASIGNAICLFNIIAACSVAGIKETNKVLLVNLWPALLAGIVMATAGWIYLRWL